jgi:hypothetical protein
VSKLSHLKKFVEDDGMSFLRRANTLLRELQLQRRDGEPTVEAGFGVYRHQTDNGSPAEGRVKNPRSTAASPRIASIKAQSMMVADTDGHLERYRSAVQGRLHPD